MTGVSKSYSDRGRERFALRDVSLQIEAGELVVVWGLRRAGRSTLMRVAAGIESPDSGAVRFEGRDLADHGESLLGAEIGYVQKRLRSGEWQTALDEAMVGVLAHGVGPTEARARASAALERVDAARWAGLQLGELDSAETVRVALARTLALRPRLLVIDDPVKGVELIDRDAILLLLRSLADEGTAVLASALDVTALSGADRALALGDGELRGDLGGKLAPVLPLRQAAQLRANG
jgi:ABC-type multidrug transport system ATPase subunit